MGESYRVNGDMYSAVNEEDINKIRRRYQQNKTMKSTRITKILRYMERMIAVIYYSMPSNNSKVVR